MASDRIVFNNKDYGKRVAEKAGTHYNSDCDVCIAREKDGEFLGGVIFTNYTKESIGMHSASFDHYWINKDMLFATFDYPFRQLGVKRIFGVTPEDNIHAIDFNAKVGFKKVARIAGVYPKGVAAIVQCLEKEDCRFLGVKPKNIRSNMS